ncbi:SBBP repeat-containing protein, partial [Acidobacteriota bacterium]
MEESPPVAWQEIDGQRHPVEVTYKKRGEKEIGFNVGEHNDRYPLVIDPVLGWHTFLGGVGADTSSCIAIDASGNVYVAGRSTSTWGTPVNAITPAPVPSEAGVYGYDLFVAKLDSNGLLQWNTFMGSSKDEEGGFNIAVDTSGNVYVVGYGLATWGTAPVNPFMLGAEGDLNAYDVFAVKLNSSGVLQWNTFMGSVTYDRGTGIAVDASGNVYVTGYSDATWGTPLNAHAGGEEIFVTKLNSVGTLVWNTFLGSAYYDRSYGIALDSSGNVYLSGRSDSTWGTPVSAHAGSWDIFAAKVNSSGVLQWNTFMGSGNNDYSFGIAVDPGGNVHLTGRSSSTWGTPVNAFAGGLDVFAAKLNSSGALVWNTFLGSTSDDRGYGITLDTGGNVYLAGYSNATWGIPKNDHSGNLDAFGARLNSSGALEWNSFLGTPGNDYGYGVAVDSSGYIYVSGYSSGTWGSPINAFVSDRDAFAAKIDPNKDLTVTSPNGSESWLVGSAQNITWTTLGTVGSIKIEYSTDHGATWIEIVSSTPNDGSHPWTIPYTPSAQCLVRVSDLADVNLFDTSNSVFVIWPLPNLELNLPNGAETWEVGSVKNIIWTPIGTVGPVKIEYSTNSGAVWATIVASTANTGTYPWTIPNTLSAQCLVRISEAADGNPVDTSDLLFSIVPESSITLTSPNGGESWLVGSVQNIPWTTTGTVGPIKIEYSMDNGTTWIEIVSSTSNDGVHPWTIPNTPSAQCLVRISEASDGSPVDTSATLFSIIASIP